MKAARNDYTPEQKALILDRYRAGERVSLCTELGITSDNLRVMVSRWSRQQKAGTLNKTRHYTPEDIAWMIENWHRGLAFVAQHFGVKRGTISERAVILRKQGHPIPRLIGEDQRQENHRPYRPERAIKPIYRAAALDEVREMMPTRDTTAGKVVVQINKKTWKYVSAEKAMALRDQQQTAA